MNSEKMKELRGQVDSLDDQICSLLLERIHLSNSIIKSKPASQIIDSVREDEICRRYCDRLASVSTPAKVKRFVQALLAASELYPS